MALKEANHPAVKGVATADRVLAISHRLPERRRLAVACRAVEPDRAGQEHDHAVGGVTRAVRFAGRLHDAGYQLDAEVFCASASLISNPSDLRSSFCPRSKSGCAVR